METDVGALPSEFVERDREATTVLRPRDADDLTAEALAGTLPDRPQPARRVDGDDALELRPAVGSVSDERELCLGFVRRPGEDEVGRGSDARERQQQRGRE